MTPDNLPPPLQRLTALPERPRLLLVDDQPINIQTLYRIFHADHEVFMATSGVQALELCQRTLPDLILLDVVMPELDGLEVCRQLKSSPLTADIPVIFVTAQNDPADETRALEAGGVDFISKPLNPAVVRARVRTHLTLKAQSDLLRELVFLDGLTGVANRRRFDDTLPVEWRHCQRSGAPLTLLLLDIDHFKLYNDHYGHQAGDACLQQVAATLRRAFRRPHDLVARYGGEEFVCLMPHCDLAAGQAQAETIRADLATQRIPHDASPTAVTVTVSIGVATAVASPDISVEALLAAADAQLYLAKKNGRDRVSAVELGVPGNPFG